MCEKLEEIAAAVEVLAGRTGEWRDSAAAMDLFERVGRAAAAGRLAALAAVERAGAWKSEGHASVAHWAAERTGSTLGHAIGSVTAAKALSGLPKTRAALASGELSVQQASEVALAAKADPASERSLLESAASTSVTELREACRMVRVAAAGDDAYERMRRSRYVRFRPADDGAIRLDGRLVPDQAAALMMWCQADADRRAKANRRSGTVEPHEALTADALCSLPAKIGTGKNGGKRGRATDAAVHATVMVHVDVAAWERGTARPGERCEIAGVGPTTVAAARRLAAQPGGALMIAIENDGNVTGVVNTGRYVPVLVGSALKARDQRCIVKSCTRRRGLQRDHKIEFGRGGETSLANLQHLCAYHHSLKTYFGWTIDGDPPNCRMSPPQEQGPARSRPPP